ncbi:hypothetical protein BpHYR1_030493 [Brachionus plicatilis]|uniref:Uncharacterized protein n=1 Tax=Brachionus plicatilis TaxID=10195 RepID=A0A3M7R8E6_BRAPC|nr:hypothetical protein BpHYR1_030493 [Brachionus plicatilis]
MKKSIIKSIIDNRLQTLHKSKASLLHLKNHLEKIIRFNSQLKIISRFMNFVNELESITNTRFMFILLKLGYYLINLLKILNFKIFDSILKYVLGIFELHNLKEAESNEIISMTEIIKTNTLRNIVSWKSELPYCYHDNKIFYTLSHFKNHSNISL